MATASVLTVSRTTRFEGFMAEHPFVTCVITQKLLFLNSASVVVTLSLSRTVRLGQLIYEAT